MKKIAYKPIGLRGLLTSICILFLAGFSVSGQQYYSFNRKIVNWGLKAGLNANAVMELHAMQGEEELTNVSFQNKTGYNITGFFRANLDRFFIQPEIEWSSLNKEISFSLPPETGHPQTVELSLHTQTANINGLIGYNMTKTGPFVFNVITGTALCYKFNTQYTILNPRSEYRDTDPVYNIYGVAGFSMNISNIHFDIRYTISFLPADMHFNNPDWLEGVVLYKRENLLSFSCGVMF